MNQENKSMENINHNYYQEDEIDIGELFNKLWGRKGFIVSFVFVAVVVVIGIMSATLLKNPPIKEYAKIIQFNFPSSSKGRYPSGKPFNANDILASKVLTDVYNMNNIKRRNVDIEHFLSAFSVSPFSINLAFIEKKFSGLLENKKLTRPQIETLEKEFLKQINAAQSRFVKVSYVETQHLGLDTITIDKILTDIPKVWSKTAIEELGVLNLKVFGSNFFQKKAVEKYEYIKALSYLSTSAKKLASGLDVLAKDSIGGSLVNPETHRTVYDLKAKLDNLQQFEIQPLFANFINLGISKSLFEAKLYIENKIQKLEDQKQLLKNKERNYKRVLESYVAQFADDGKGKSLKRSVGSAGLSQIDAGIFKQLSDLIEGKSDAKYKQALLKNRLDTLQEIEDVNAELIQFKRALKVLLKKKKRYTKEIIKGAVNYIQVITDDLGSLVQEYQQLLNLRNEQTLGNSSSLYSLVSGDLRVKSDLKEKVKKVILYSVLVGFLSLMVAVFIALIRKSPQVNEKPS